jgi:hypothetical protein
MPAPRRSHPPGSSVQSRLHHGPFAERCRHQPSCRVPTPCAMADLAPVRFHIPVDHATPPGQVPGRGKGRDTPSARRWPAPAGRHDPPAAGILGHLDALYALAYLSSGNANGAQQAVIDAFTGVCGDPTGRSACRSGLWRTLADHVHLASDGRGASPAVGPAPFRDGALSPCQREAIALRLGGRRDRDAARLLGISLGELRREIRIGLQALYPDILTDTDGGYPSVVVRDDQRFPRR